MRGIELAVRPPRDPVRYGGLHLRTADPAGRRFRATLEEVEEADLILHVRDISHPDTRRSAMTC